MQFLYKGQDAQGRIKTGSVEAPDRGAAAKAVQARGLHILELQVARPRNASLGPPPKNNSGSLETQKMPVHEVDVGRSKKLVQDVVDGLTSLGSAPQEVGPPRAPAPNRHVAPAPRNTNRPAPGDSGRVETDTPAPPQSHTVRYREANQIDLDPRKVGAAAAALLLALFLFFAFRPAPKAAKNVEAGPEGKQVTVEGVVPRTNDPEAKVHLVFPDIPYEVTKPARELGKPGEPFKLTLNVPGPSARMHLEVSEGASRHRATRDLMVGSNEVHVPALAPPPPSPPGGDGRPYPARVDNRRSVAMRSGTDRRARMEEKRKRGNRHADRERQRNGDQARTRQRTVL